MKQEEINSMPDGTVNMKKFNEYLDEYLIPDGYKEIKFDYLEVVKGGSNIRYINTDNKYRSGGLFMLLRKDDYNPGRVACIKTYNGQFMHINEFKMKRIFVKTHGTKNDVNKPYITAADAPTKYPAYDKDGAVIKYFRDNYTLQNFLKSNKYQKILKYGYILK